MNQMSRCLRCPLAAALLAAVGCFTVRETEFAPVEAAELPAVANVPVQVAGFDMTETTFETAYGYTTVTGLDAPWYDRHGRRHGGFATRTYSTTEFIPHTAPTDFYRNRATDLLESAGCIVQTTKPQYRVEVRFEGLLLENGDFWKSLGWALGSLFTAGYNADTWAAKLKVHDLSTGKLVFARDFVRRDEALVWGPIPIFSPACSARTDASRMKGNCLAALTDESVVAALKFLSERTVK